MRTQVVPTGATWIQPGMFYSGLPTDVSGLLLGACPLLVHAAATINKRSRLMSKRSLSFVIVMGCVSGAHAFSYADAGALVSTAPDWTRTEKAGEEVRAKGNAQHTYTTKDGSVRDAAGVSVEVKASASIGVNRLGGGGAYALGELPEGAVNSSGPAVVSGSTYSRWYDTLRVSGTSSEWSPVKITLRGTTFFELDETSPFFIAPSADGLAGRPLEARQSLTIGGSDVASWTMKDFVAATDPLNRTGRINWSHTYDWYANVDLLVGVTFNVTSEAGAAFNMDPRCQQVFACQGVGAFSSYNTTLLERIEIEGGTGLTSSSGELVAKDGYYTFQAVIDHTSPVPEPATLSLLACGLAFVVSRCWRPRDSQRFVASTENIRDPALPA